MPFESTLVFADAAGYATPLLVLLVPEGEMPASLQPLDVQTGGALQRVYAAGDFRGKQDEQTVVYPAGPAPKVLLSGFGKPEGDLRASLRRAAAAGAKRARALGVESLAVHATGTGTTLTAPDLARVLAEGVAQGAWAYDAPKRPAEDRRPKLARADLLFPDRQRAEVEAGFQAGAAIGAGHAFARDLQVLPGNVCTPTFLADTAADLARRHGMTCTVLDRPAIEREGMNALMAVGQGSAQDPRFIVLEYQGSPAAPVVLVGKGITFDTGGISIKPADRMEDMKFDMSGAAAVLGTFEMLGRLRPRVHVIGLIPSAENMPSGRAYKPGDVVGSHFGKTIEVINTDAEGRLILVDALSYARRFKPACVLDAATLTGAVVIALGHTAAGLLGTDVALLNEVRDAAERSGERVWELPLHEEYRELIKSDVADVKNSGGRPAGTITAAWFLREFVEGYPWAHLDIAGTAYTDRDTPSMSRGPTGMGTRLFSEFVLARG